MPRRTLSAIVAVLALIAGAATTVGALASRAEGSVPLPTSSSAALWGIDDNASFDSVEAGIGRKFAVVREYRRLDQTFVNSRMQSLAADGRSMVISVKSRNASNPIPYSAVTAGQYDSAFLKGFAAMDALPTPTYFIYQHEADSTAAKAACSQQTDATCGPEFVAAWRHVYNLARSHGYNKLIFAWTITSYGFNPQTNVRNNYYWPGAAYTDWIGVDAYNGGCEGTWYGDFEQTLASAVNWVQAHAPDKPIIIPELGATEGATANAKAAFFNGIPATLAKPGYSNIKAIVYWNNTENGCDFRVNSSTASYNAYRTTSQDPMVAARATDQISLAPVVEGASLHAMSPTRVLDTRQGVGASGPVGAGKAITLTLPSSVVPTNASAVAMNVTVTQPQAGGHITVFPGGTPMPTASNLNFAAGQTIPNLVVVKLGAGRTVSFNNSARGTAHLVADLAAYYTEDATGGSFAPTSPTRVLDTRFGTGLTGPVGAGQTVTLTLPTDVVPTGAGAVALNVTVTEPGAGGHITVFPGGSAMPTASNLNFAAGQTIPNMVLVKVGPGGTVSFNNSAAATVHLVADLAGFFGAGASGAAYHATAPVRVMDTRSGTGVRGPVAAGTTVTLTLPANVIPADATAVTLNVTVTQPQAGGYSTVFPGGTTRPTASNLNFIAGQTIPNLVMAKVGAGRTVSFTNRAGGSAHLIADLAGYYTNP